MCAHVSLCTVNVRHTHSCSCKKADACINACVGLQVCHAPSLLLDGKGRLIGRFRCLNHALHLVPTWVKQWRKLTPAQRADCMLVTPVTYSRLGFLTANGKVRQYGCEHVYKDTEHQQGAY